MARVEGFEPSHQINTESDIMLAMSDYVTKDELNTALQKQTEEIVGLIQAFMHQVDDRFNKLENDIAELKDSHNRLLNTIDGFISRIDKYETELAARDNQIEKLIAWARKVSEKTGIPLENL
jgi:septal ring factor EnvC (AmiA/AmiB activator)